MPFPTHLPPCALENSATWSSQQIQERSRWAFSRTGTKIPTEPTLIGPTGVAAPPCARPSACWFPPACWSPPGRRHLRPGPHLRNEPLEYACAGPSRGDPRGAAASSRWKRRGWPPSTGPRATSRPCASAWTTSAPPWPPATPTLRHGRHRLPFRRPRQRQRASRRPLPAASAWSSQDFLDSLIADRASTSTRTASTTACSKPSPPRIRKGRGLRHGSPGPHHPTTPRRWRARKAPPFVCC